jgi:hypothetical protein
MKERDMHQVVKALIKEALLVTSGSITIQVDFVFYTR